MPPLAHCALVVFAQAVMTWPAVPGSPTATAVQLKSIYAGIHSLDDFKNPKTKALVLAFLDTECPIAQKQLTKMTHIPT